LDDMNAQGIPDEELGLQVEDLGDDEWKFL
ncbi:hypothetical protein LCGC14_3118830, partial [marine sediment metagenome]